jgi:hypothetical protein
LAAKLGTLIQKGNAPQPSPTARGNLVTRSISALAVTFLQCVAYAVGFGS